MDSKDDRWLHEKRMSISGGESTSVIGRRSGIYLIRDAVRAAVGGRGDDWHVEFGPGFEPESVDFTAEKEGVGVTFRERGQIDMRKNGPVRGVERVRFRGSGI